ncbi:hypothetical protein [Brachyspira catarrhinii]|uniref:Lipoprotein n=1 Tax=Brachyspira catarrhinii TaxID=2528966 RepID=A0ABY2TS70_9SPIR|nr:hypothetical protein [Brachyspira catarrhinii]TKZ35611.1 hypothetical protein EZH24_04355 [Brachyspira catarrhinii]
MIKRIIIIISLSMLALACNKNTASSGKPLTKNTPSVNKSVKQGSLSLNASKTALFSVSKSVDQSSTSTSGDTNTNDITTITPAEDTTANDSKAENEKVYSVLTRLYSTVWFQTEEEYDDGQVETDSTFLYFNEDSKVEERELETGEPDESEYSIVEIVEGIELVTSQNNNDTTRDRNACIVKNTEIGDNDSEYQLYYLKDENTLYVIELTENYTKASELKTKADSIIKEIEGNNAVKYNEDKYALSTI